LLKNKPFARLWVGAAATALAVTLAACAGGMSRTVDASASSIVPGDAAALGFDPAKLDLARQGLRADVQSGKIPGAVLIIGRHGQVVFNESFGVQGPGQTTPMSTETIFRVFSMTKPIVTVTAMKLVEEGKLSIDDPVSKYLPEFASMNVYVPGANGAAATTRPSTRPMLVRHLMSHTSGLIYGFIQPQAPISRVWDAGGEARTDLTPTQWARQVVSKLPLTAEPGTAWNYSRSTDVLGAVVEVASGQPLDVAVEQRVTRPLGMTDTHFFQPAAAAPRIAQPKAADPLYYDPTVVTPFKQGGGGISSTPEDYLRFVLMLEGNGSYKGVQILKPETLAAMRVDQTTDAIRRAGLFFPAMGPTAGSMGFGLGFSLVLDDTKQRPGNGTFSWNGIAGTEFWVDPKNDVFMAFFIQDRALLSEYQRRNRAWIYDALVRP
jgi:CubicO group peptidase (beta-lactamase class C family)